MMDTKPKWDDDGEVQVVPENHPWAAAYPAVWWYLTGGAGSGVGPRQAATMTVLVEHGLTKACVNDRHKDRSLWRSGATLDECLVSLEAALQEGKADWRYYGGPRKPRGK